jgi:hypothetical protein
MSLLLAIPWHVYVSMLVFSIVVGLLTAIEVHDLAHERDEGATFRS